MSILICDGDGPLFVDQTPEFFLWVNQLPEIKHPWCYTTFLHTGDWVQATHGLRPHQTHPLYERFTRSDAHIKTLFTRGARQTIRQLKQIKLHLATARSPAVQEDTLSALESHIGQLAGSHFGIHWEKVDVARSLQANLFIDDNYPLTRAVSEQTQTPSILFPARGTRQVSQNNGVIILDSEGQATVETPLDKWQQICHAAWQQIADLLPRFLA